VSAADRPATRNPRAGRKVGWGFADQVFSSATNFALTIIAGRWLGPSGLGVVSLGFSAYVLAVIFQRALITEPHTVISATLPREERTRVSRRAVAMSLVAGIAVGGGLVVVGLILGGPVGRGFVIFGPWIPFTLLQDLWRYVLFRDNRNAAAVTNDATWVIGMVVSMPIAYAIHTDWAVVGSWGFGAVLSMALGFVQTKMPPSRPRESWAWWLRDAWPVGKWFAADRLASNTGTQGTVFILAPLLGAVALGGLKATNSVFAPLSVLGPSITLPALPMMTRAYHESARLARTTAVRLSLIVTGLTTLYTVFLAAGGGVVLAFLFGSKFRHFTSLIVPTAAGQLMASASIGFIVLLKASKRGRPLVVAHVISTVGTLIVTPILAIKYGVVGAAWGLAIGYGLESLALIVLSWKLPTSVPQPEGHLAGAELDADASPGDMTGAQSQ
jgi:O-antigen/teichoic acid export membrane protein